MASLGESIVIHDSLPNTMREFFLRIVAFAFRPFSKTMTTPAASLLELSPDTAGILSAFKTKMSSLPDDGPKNYFEAVAIRFLIKTADLGHFAKVGSECSNSRFALLTFYSEHSAQMLLIRASFRLRITRHFLLFSIFCLILWKLNRFGASRPGSCICAGMNWSWTSFTSRATRKSPEGWRSALWWICAWGRICLGARSASSTALWSLFDAAVPVFGGFGKIMTELEANLTFWEGYKSNLNNQKPDSQWENGAFI